MLKLFPGVCRSGQARNVPLDVIGLGARHHLKETVTHELEVLAHGLLRRMGFSLSDGGDDTAVLFHEDLLSVAGPSPLAQKPPGRVLPDAVDHIKDYQ
jgi:hypothetical protein